MCFAAGSLISSSLTIAFPHALEKNVSAGLAALAGLTTPVGAFLVYPVVNLFSSSILGAALWCVSGVLIYLSAAHLLPTVREGEKGHSYLAFMFGIGLS